MIQASVATTLEDVLKIFPELPEIISQVSFEMGRRHRDADMELTVTCRQVHLSFQLRIEKYRTEQVAMINDGFRRGPMRSAEFPVSACGNMKIETVAPVPWN
jgi:hypothetical protein